MKPELANAAADWMSDLADSVPLSCLTVPGSHDTCAYTVEDPLAKTQGATLTEQLINGVRALDIRCRHENDVFYINHARIPLGLMFDEVLAACQAFLQQHPGECIVMSVKDECGTHSSSRTFQRTFTDYVVSRPNVRWYLRDAIPTLGEVRGAVVLLRRFESETRLGIDLSAWSDNATFDLDNQHAAFTIQDEFRVPVRASVEYKWRVIQALLHDTPRLCDERWVINFCSGTGMAANPRVVACGDTRLQGINERLAGRLTQHSGPAGTIMLDFCEHADWALVRILVARNRASLVDG